MAKENTSRYAILGMLALKPTSGYGIKKLMEQSTSNFWSESYGQIYPILKQLTGEGLATSHTERQEGKPERNVYTLTARGQSELQNWLEADIEDTPERIEILLKLFFGRLLPAQTNIAHIQQFHTRQQHLLHRYQEIESRLMQQVQEGGLGQTQGLYALITVRYGIHHCRSLLAWCEEALASIHTFRATSEL